MKMQDAVAGRWMTKEDVTTAGINLDIGTVDTDNVGNEQELVYVMTWLDRNYKPLILNKTNIRILMALFGPESDDWRGKTVNVYNDLSVTFGQNVGGVRVRQAVEKQFDDDVPAAFG